MAVLSKKYSDPEWSAITAQAEKKAGIPAGFLHSIVNYGERSNADQVSEAGARTPYQIIPSTAKLIQKKYGIDPYLSPENSALGAALLLKESLDRNNGDVALAAAEYHGGTDRKNWGRKTKAYVSRVTSGMQSAQPDPNAQTIEDGTGGATVADKPEPTLEAVHAAYRAGKFTPEQKAEYEADLASGVLPPPDGEVVETTATEETTTEAVELPENVAEAYVSGKMDTKQMRELEADVASGLIKMPRGYGTTETGLGVVGGAAEMVTGSERTTPESEAATELGSGTDVRMLVEGSGLDDAGVMRLGADVLTATNPEEAADIIVNKTNGAVTKRTDEKGNLFLTNTKTGQDVIINKPGLSGMDAFQGTFIGGLAALALTPAGRVAEAGGGGLLATAGTVGGLSALAQTGIEAEQASQGGEFNPADIALAGAIPAAVPLVNAAARPAINAIAPKVMQGVNAVKTIGSRGAQAIPEPSPVGAGTVLQQADEVIPPPIAAPVEAPVVAPRATQAEIDAIQAPDAPVTAKPEMAAEDFGALARKASEGSRKAQEDLAAVVDVNPEAKAAADALGLELPADLISDSKLLSQTAGLSRGIVGAESSAWRDTVTQVGKKADEVLEAMDGSTDVATLSETVKNNLSKTRSDLKSAESKIYSEVDKQVPARTKVTMSTTAKELKQMIDDAGGVKHADPALVKLYKRATSKGVTYSGMKDLRQDIGEQLGNMMNKGTYGSAGERKLRIIYGALASDTLEAVEKTVGGEAGAALRQDLRYANKLTATRKALEKRIVNTFGKEGEGSIAAKLTAAVKSGAKGDIAGLNKLLNTVPKEMHKETVITALMNSARTPQGNFSPNAFTNLYQGIRKNAPVAKLVFGQLSKEENETLRQIYTISKRTRDAENAISKTGKANQPLYDALIAQNAIGSLLDSAAGKMTQQAVSAIPSGGAARAVVGKVVEAVTTTPVERLAAVNKLLGSSEFSDLLEAASKTGSSEAPEKIARRFAASKVFSDFAKAVNMPRELTAREQYVITLLQGGKGGIQETDNKGKF
jgi:hypothetical protein